MVINDAFRRDNYYMTSLGNSLSFDKNTIEAIHWLINAKGIKEISFVLSYSNVFINDALQSQSFSNVFVLSDTYYELARLKKRTRITWKARDSKEYIISYYLTNKVMALMPLLDTELTDRLQVNAMIYYENENTFREVFSNLIYNRDFVLS